MTIQEAKDNVMKNFTKFHLKLLKNISHEIWNKYDDTFKYRSEKQERNKNISIDIPDNIWFFWGQFDMNNQKEMLDKLWEMANKNNKEAEYLYLFLTKELLRKII